MRASSHDNGVEDFQHHLHTVYTTITNTCMTANYQHLADCNAIDVARTQSKITQDLSTVVVKSKGNQLNAAIQVVPT